MTGPNKNRTVTRRPFGREPRPLTPEEIEYNRRLAIRLQRRAEVNEMIGYTNSPARTRYENCLDLLGQANTKHHTGFLDSKQKRKGR